MSRLTALKERADQESRRAREVAEKAQAENRSMTAPEQATYDSSMKSLNEILDVVKSVKEDEAILGQAKEFGRAIGVGADSKTGQRLSFKGMGATAAKQISPASLDGQKALAPSGATVVNQEFRADPIALGQIANSILDILPTFVHGTPEYSYLRQTTRTNNAAVVAAAAVKPTSVYSLERVDAALAVIAHLSEGITKYWLADNMSLERFVANEMEYGLLRAVEAKVVADINATSGIQTQAYSTSVLQTLRKTLTKLEVAGYVTGAFILHPTDFEAIELALSSTNAIEHMSLPFDATARRLFGAPVVVTPSQAVGVSHTLAQDAVGLDTDGRVEITWNESSNSDDWSKNLLRARCEGRFNTSVFSPLGVVVGDLTA